LKDRIWSPPNSSSTRESQLALVGAHSFQKKLGEQSSWTPKGFLGVELAAEGDAIEPEFQESCFGVELTADKLKLVEVFILIGKVLGEIEPPQRQLSQWGVNGYFLVTNGPHPDCKCTVVNAVA
jgi:hypothetical protein